MHSRKKIPLLGKKVGKLTCIDDSEEKWPGFRRMIKVECECGEVERVDAVRFREEKITACNKCKPRNDTSFQSVLGQSFGDWIVIEEKERGSNRRAKCRCKCGQIEMVQVSGLRSGHSTGCLSCRSFKSAIGEKYGKLTVTAEPERGLNRKVLCDCDCGKKGFLVRLCNLQYGTTKSCGCMKHYESYETGVIYYLLDLILKAHYVGQTVRDPKQRLSEHILNIKSNPAKVRWIHSLYPYKPEIFIAEENIPLDKLTERENFHIERCLRRKQPLLNILLPSKISA